MIKRDYAEALKAEFNMKIQSEAFGINCTISIEDSNCEYHDKYRNSVSNEANVKMDFHSHSSGESAQNAATTREYMKFFIHWMYGGHLFIKDGIIYDNKYGCRKKIHR